MDEHKNFALSEVAIAPSPADSGLSLTITADEGQYFPSSFYAVICPHNAKPTRANAEIVRVTRTDDTFAITRAQGGSTARSVGVGDDIFQGVLAEDFDNIVEGPSSSVTGGIAIFSNATGKLLEDSVVTLSDVQATALAAAIAGILPVNLSSGVTGRLPLANVAAASAANRLLGRGSASGGGDFQEITLGNSVALTGTVLDAIQDIRTSAAPRFAGLGIAGAAKAGAAIYVNRNGGTGAGLVFSKGSNSGSNPALAVEGPTVGQGVRGMIDNQGAFYSNANFVMSGTFAAALEADGSVTVSNYGIQIPSPSDAQMFGGFLSDQPLALALKSYNSTDPGWLIQGFNKTNKYIFNITGETGRINWGIGSTLASMDVGLDRTAAATLAIGNGTSGDFSGRLIASSVGLGTSTVGAGEQIRLQHVSNALLTLYAGGTPAEAGRVSASPSVMLLASPSELRLSATSPISFYTDGVERTTITPAGLFNHNGTMQLTEMTTPDAGAVNTVRLYAVDNGGGKTQLMVLFASGAAQQIAIQP